jgi:hypothetical protein
MFSIHDDFPNHALASDRLTIEIAESVIVTALGGISTSGDVCDIAFKADLSSGDEVVLEALVAAHSGDPLPDVHEVRAADGKLYVSPDMWATGTLTNFCGAADTVATGQRGDDLLSFISTAAGVLTKVFRFVQPAWLAGGHIQYQGAVSGDWINFTTTVPATAGVAAPGAGAYAKVPVGASKHVFVPAPGGGWDLDLVETENANVAFTKVRPVPAPGNHGFFDYDMDTEAVTPNVAGKGGYHLCDYEVVLAEFITKVSLLGSDHFPLTVPAVRPILILPHWQHHFALNNATEKTLTVASMLYIGRMNNLR